MSFQVTACLTDLGITRDILKQCTELNFRSEQQYEDLQSWHQLTKAVIQMDLGKKMRNPH